MLRHALTLLWKAVFQECWVSWRWDIFPAASSWSSVGGGCGHTGNVWDSIWGVKQKHKGFGVLQHGEGWLWGDRIGLLPFLYAD